MNKVLFIRSSVRGADSISNQLADAMATRIRSETHVAITERNVGTGLIPQLDSELISAMRTPADTRTAEQQKLVALSDTLVGELKDADTVVIATGMVNFSITTQLKNYFDHVLRAGLTFQYTSQGPQGLLQGKKAIILAATGGVYSEGPAAAADFMTPYLVQLLSFIGITDVQVVRAEAQGMGGDTAANAVTKAKKEIEKLPLA